MTVLSKTVASMVNTLKLVLSHREGKVHRLN